MRVKGRGCHTLLKPYETNCGLCIWAIQIKFDWLIDWLILEGVRLRGGPLVLSVHRTKGAHPPHGGICRSCEGCKSRHRRRTESSWPGQWVKRYVPGKRTVKLTLCAARVTNTSARAAHLSIALRVRPNMGWAMWRGQQPGEAGTTQGLKDLGHTSFTGGSSLQTLLDPQPAALTAVLPAEGRKTDTALLSFTDRADYARNNCGPAQSKRLIVWAETSWIVFIVEWNIVSDRWLLICYCVTAPRPESALCSANALFRLAAVRAVAGILLIRRPVHSWTDLSLPACLLRGEIPAYCLWWWLRSPLIICCMFLLSLSLLFFSLS